VGIADGRAAQRFPWRRSTRHLFVSSMTTYELARFPVPPTRPVQHHARIQPRRGSVVAEVLVRPRATGARRSESTVSLRYRWMCDGVDDGADGVAVRLSSAEHGSMTVRARYLVACDGAASPTRKALGIGSLRDSARSEHAGKAPSSGFPGCATASRTPGRAVLPDHPAG